MALLHPCLTSPTNALSFILDGPVAGDPRAGPSDGPEFTDYAVRKAPKEKVHMVRGYRNRPWRKIDLKRLDFSKGTTWPLEDGSLGIVDITDAGDSASKTKREL
ncbi:cbh [Symbiodinium sp. CCMP2456]|nr:cbh [Symbiodinium sp. CCMP2456]